MTEIDVIGVVSIIPFDTVYWGDIRGDIINQSDLKIELNRLDVKIDETTDDLINHETKPYAHTSKADHDNWNAKPNKADVVLQTEKGVRGGVPRIGSSNGLIHADDFTQLTTNNVSYLSPAANGVSNGSSFIMTYNLNQSIFPELPPNAHVFGISIATGLSNAVQIVAPTGIDGVNHRLAVRGSDNSFSWSAWKEIPNKDDVQNMIDASIGSAIQGSY